jgi:DNA-binding transcriptional regulator YdaS (Cro superfamily)
MTKTQAIKWAGGVVKLAKRLGIKPQAVSQWPGDQPIPRLREYQIRELQQRRTA